MTVTNDPDHYFWWLFIQYKDDTVYYRRIHEGGMRSVIAKALLLLRKMQQPQRKQIREYGVLYAPFFDMKKKDQPCWARHVRYQSLNVAVPQMIEWGEKNKKAP